MQTNDASLPFTVLPATCCAVPVQGAGLPAAPEASAAGQATVTPALTLAGLTLRLARTLSRLERDTVCCEDVTVQQCYTLTLLRDGRPRTMQQLADALGLALSTVTRNVDVLERRGALLRERDSVDGRVVHVRLTGAGCELAGRLFASEVECCERVLELVPPERRVALVVALQDLIGAAERLRQDEACCP